MATDGFREETLLSPEKRSYVRLIAHTPAVHYIGDGIYVDVGPHELLLTTEDGIGVTNEIVIDELQIVRELVNYLQQLLDRVEKETK